MEARTRVGVELGVEAGSLMAAGVAKCRGASFMLPVRVLSLSLGDAALLVGAVRCKNSLSHQLIDAPAKYAANRFDVSAYVAPVTRPKRIVV